MAVLEGTYRSLSPNWTKKRKGKSIGVSKGGVGGEGGSVLVGEGGRKGKGSCLREKNTLHSQKTGLFYMKGRRKKKGAEGL